LKIRNRDNNTPVHAIRVVQYKLTDYVGGKPKPVDDIICERLTQDQKIKSVPQIVLLNSDHFGEVNPLCPRCGSKKYIKNGFRRRHPKIGNYGEITVYVQRYECKKCGKGFSARIDGIVKKWRQYAEIFKERVNALAAIKKYSGRKIQQVLLALFGVAPSHQTIENWLCAQIPPFSYSGYYCYDEQVVRIRGIRTKDYCRIAGQLSDHPFIRVNRLAQKVKLHRNTVSRYIKKMYSHSKLIGPWMSVKLHTNYIEYMYLLNFADPLTVSKELKG